MFKLGNVILAPTMMSADVSKKLEWEQQMVEKNFLKDIFKRFGWENI